MGKKKIFNDPVYGIIGFPYEILYDIIDHPYFQRLRRISQMGLSHYIYPGALHTRFHHALGALHLMTRALSTLKDKGIEITEEESKGACIAILLHDIGHGPYSHALEGELVPFHHEDLSLAFMEYFNELYEGELDIAIKIFKNQYPKSFLYQLVSGQLDMDRMDYLNRDSFFTGVAEGVIGYDRIIKMLYVMDNQIVIEEKGIYSIEKFLMARRLMYWQVYLHKTSIATEQMLIRFVKILKEPSNAEYINGKILKELIQWDSENISFALLEKYAAVDDIDLMMELKMASVGPHFLLQYISRALLNRRLFQISLKSDPIDAKNVDQIKSELKVKLGINSETAEQLVINGTASNQEYVLHENEIRIYMKDGSVKPFSEVSEYPILSSKNEKYYLCYPRM